MEAAKRLGWKSSDNVGRYVRMGLLRKVNGLIPESSIQEFLGNKTIHTRRRA